MEAGGRRRPTQGLEGEEKKKGLKKVLCGTFLKCFHHPLFTLVFLETGTRGEVSEAESFPRPPTKAALPMLQGGPEWLQVGPCFQHQDGPRVASRRALGTAPGPSLVPTPGLLRTRVQLQR
uniref:Uncharacterized protein n=1 Tax=Gadus morhua TaxID=8049 RepID=A0A8C5C8Y7_GADMO